MAVDTRFVVDSFALSARFAALGITQPENALLPRSYQRVQTNYLKQNRKETFAVDYSQTNKRYTFPESLNVLASAYLCVTLPENASANYKTIPGMWVIKTVTIRSNGDLVMSIPYQTLLQDHFASLTDEESRAKAAAQFGYVSPASGAARRCWLPIPLPNSSLWMYGGRGQGAYPFKSHRNNKLEISFDFYDNTATTADRNNVSPAMTNTEIVMKEVIAPLTQMPSLADARGKYSLVSRRYTPIQDFTDGVDNATEHNITVSNLSGCVPEIIVEAYPYQANDDDINTFAPVTPSSVKLTCDSVECINVESEDEARLIEYGHGFRSNEFYSGNVYRLVFGSHGADIPRAFQGAMNFSGITQATLKLKFPERVRFRVTAVQMGVTSITSSGRLVQKLD